MKAKKLIASLLSVVLLLVFFAGCTTQQPGADTPSDSPSATPSADPAAETPDVPASEPLKIGWTVGDMTNPIFAQGGAAFEALCKENGWEVTLLDCQKNVATQITQVENFIQSEIDVLIIYPAEASALEEVCGRAREAGVKVFSWDLELENADMSWLVYNYELGQMIGTMAADWANENYPDGCEVAIMDVATVPVIVERANGIKDAITEKAPNCTIVAQDSAATVAAGMDLAENMLQAHPDIKVFATIGDGASCGANEALKAAGANLDEYGCFGADAAKEALTAMAANEAVRGTVSLGTGEEWAVLLTDFCKTLTGDAPFEKLVYKPMTLVTAENLADFYTA